MTDLGTVAVLIVGFALQPILYELSPLPDLIERIKKRKARANWWDRLWKMNGKNH